MNLAIRKDTLTEEQKALIQQAGDAYGIPVTSNEQKIHIKDLSSNQYDQLMFGFQVYWGIGRKEKS
jgi:hypothetical protein